MKQVIAITIWSLLCCCIFSFSYETDEALQKDKLIAIAKEYLHYSKIEKKTPDQKKVWSWTVAACGPGTVQPLPEWCYNKDTINFSKASSSISMHGNKLYSLYVKDYNSYSNEKIKSQPDGQVVVKETWTTTQVDSGYVSPLNIIARKNENDDKWYVPAIRSHLFIMYKEAETADNDKGWVYGIVNIENAVVANPVIDHGKLSNCIGCHKDTKYDRIFGVAP